MTLWVDSVEEVRELIGLNAAVTVTLRQICKPDPVSGRLQVRYRYQLGQFAEVLGGCCEEELITSAVRSS